MPPGGSLRGEIIIESSTFHGILTMSGNSIMKRYTMAVRMRLTPRVIESGWKPLAKYWI